MYIQRVKWLLSSIYEAHPPQTKAVSIAQRCIPVQRKEILKHIIVVVGLWRHIGIVFGLTIINQ